MTEKVSELDAMVAEVRAAWSERLGELQRTRDTGGERSRSLQEADREVHSWLASVEDVDPAEANSAMVEKGNDILARIRRL